MEIPLWNEANGVYFLQFKAPSKVWTKSFIGPPYHGTAKVPDVSGRYGPLVLFALKNDMEAHESVQSRDSLPIDTLITGTASNFVSAQCVMQQLVFCPRT